MFVVNTFFYFQYFQVFHDTLEADLPFLYFGRTAIILLIMTLSNVSNVIKLSISSIVD